MSQDLGPFPSLWLKPLTTPPPPVMALGLTPTTYRLPHPGSKTQTPHLCAGNRHPLASRRRYTTPEQTGPGNLPHPPEGPEEGMRHPTQGTTTGHRGPD